MKRQFLIILAVLLILSLIVGLYIYNYQKQQLIAKKNNQFYENYAKGQILGTDLISIINKAMDTNEKNAIMKKGIYYQDDKEKTIKIYIQFLEDERTILMEDIAEKATENFIKYFGQAQFECTKIEYHANTGNVKAMYFLQE